MGLSLVDSILQAKPIGREKHFVIKIERMVKEVQRYDPRLENSDSEIGTFHHILQ
jgi:hypothetical protein